MQPCFVSSMMYAPSMFCTLADWVRQLVRAIMCVLTSQVYQSRTISVSPTPCVISRQVFSCLDHHLGSVREKEVSPALPLQHTSPPSPSVVGDHNDESAKSEALVGQLNCFHLVEVRQVGKGKCHMFVQTNLRIRVGANHGSVGFRMFLSACLLSTLWSCSV